MIVVFKQVRDPPWQPQSRGQKEPSGVVPLGKITREFVAENRRARDGKTKVKRISRGKGEGAESISLSQTSASYALTVNVQMAIRPTA